MYHAGYTGENNFCCRHARAQAGNFQFLKSADSMLIFGIFHEKRKSFLNFFKVSRFGPNCPQINDKILLITLSEGLNSQPFLHRNAVCQNYLGQFSAYLFV